MFFKPESQREHKYDLSGNLNEQCRDAIKNGDNSGVKKLLEAKANPNYKDPSGNTLLHMAAMFDRTDAVKLLMRLGANAETKNAQKETPIGVAPVMLADRMKKWAAQQKKALEKE
mmetsp:Transcript_8056/g.11421  ORF Transcript_8056/g.11421 Transcript_8056/m.11421 type:complete len:115 (-) Transcript_8056:85-429(-)|eukprot:CAMPEP_0184488190 /NCGR_PEP_ID=MMETSP0113_2-20130426/10581_1 /TAXON_ID=91329 /ORGANISM="Norrisiella sphaerica, Strain BC52" /LENGTH=114 /DNA_ID=CAMNT_0026870685 /DNA_START=119 /DNA_END=463 /DNA_ORIENTATION=-